MNDQTSTEMEMPSEQFGEWEQAVKTHNLVDSILRRAVRPYLLLALYSSVLLGDESLRPAIPTDRVALVGYSAATGEIWVDDWQCDDQSRTAPSADRLESFHLISASGVFTHTDRAEGLNGVFDRVSQTKLFKLSVNGFGDMVSFGRIAEIGQTEEFLLADWEVSGSGDCGELEWGLSYFPMPNLAGTTLDDANRISIHYRELTGEMSVTAESTATDWLGIYSGDGNITTASEQESKISQRVHYLFEITPHASQSISLVPGLSKEQLLSDISVVASDEQRRPLLRDVGFGYIPRGDVTDDQLIDANDIDALTSAIAMGDNSNELDLDRDGQVSGADREFLIVEVLQTYFGDSNLDGVFDSRDLVQVFRENEYRDTIPHNSTWATGDWNGDFEFDSKDFVFAFVHAGYEKGPRPTVVIVAEPHWSVVGLCPFLFTLLRRQSSGVQGPALSSPARVPKAIQIAGSMSML